MAGVCLMSPITLLTGHSNSFNSGDIVAAELVELCPVSGLLLYDVEVEEDVLQEPPLPLLLSPLELLYWSCMFWHFLGNRSAVLSWVWHYIDQ